jgi:hypothetical protein
MLLYLLIANSSARFIGLSVHQCDRQKPNNEVQATLTECLFSGLDALSEGNDNDKNGGGILIGTVNTADQDTGEIGRAHV